MINLIKFNDGVILKSFLNDAKHFLSKNREILNTAPLQVYSSAIVFAPETSIIRNRFKDHIPEWLLGIPIVDNDWGTELQSFEGHSDRVTSVAFSSDGKMIASGSDEGTIIVWNTATGDIQSSFEVHATTVRSVAFSSYDLIASSSDDTTIKIWNAFTGELHQSLEGHTDSVWSIAWSLHDDLLASGSGDGTVKLWNSATGDLHRTFEKRFHDIYSVAFSSSNELIASGCSYGTIDLWNAATGDLHRMFEGHPAAIESIAFSSSNELLASGSADKTIKIWNLITGDLQRTLEGHSEVIRSVAFASHDQLLASGSEDQTIKIWNTSTGDLQQTLYDSTPISSIAFSPKSEVLIAGCWSAVKSWDIARSDTQKAHGELSSSIIKVVFSSDSKMLAVACEDGTTKLWNTVTNDVQCVIPGPSGWKPEMTFSPDNTSIVISARGHTQFWDPVKGTLQFTIDGATQYPKAISPDGKLLAMILHKRLSLWELASGIVLQTFNQDGASSLAFSSNGKLLASCDYDHENIMVWNIATGVLQQTIPIDWPWPVKIWFHPEKPLLFSNAGIIEVQGSLTETSLSTHQRDFVFLIDNWITWNEERVMWLPLAYRQIWDCSEKTMALRNGKNQVTLIEIDFSKFSSGQPNSTVAHLLPNERIYYYNVD